MAKTNKRRKPIKNKSNKKKQKQNASSKKSVEQEPKPGNRALVIGTVVAALIVVAFIIANSIAPSDPVTSLPDGTGLDDYGRSPGHPHYGHDHPTSQDTAPAPQPATQPGGADAYGRYPGHEHYGHDHE